jgi:hypothetical protein
MARRAKHDPKITHVVMRVLDTLSRQHGITEVRHACNKWTSGMQARARLTKARARLRSELREINRRMAA